MLAKGFDLVIATFVKETGYDFGPSCIPKGQFHKQAGNEPAVCVSWEDAHVYVRWLSNKTGKKYRLLSEAEWEYAARGGNQLQQVSGEDLCKAVNGGDLTLLNGRKRLGESLQCWDGFAYTAPVGMLSPNGFGLYDMLGNVSEWVEDCSHTDYAGAPSDGSVWQGAGKDCMHRVKRGGSWDSKTDELRFAYRYLWIGPSIQDFTLGFRVARTLTR